VATNSERTAATRGALIAAARRLFADRGFAATATTDILAGAGVSRGALYHHFRNKEDLFLAVYEAVEEDLARRIVDASSKGRNAMRRLRLGLDTFLELCLDTDVQRIVLLDGPTVLDWETWHAIDERYTFGLIEATLNEAMQAGEIARQPATPLAHALFGAAIQAALVVARSPDPRAAKRQMTKTFDRLLAAL
jgi:AcrR family transcriptional regulator